MDAIQGPRLFSSHFSFRYSLYKGTIFWYPFRFLQFSINLNSSGKLNLTSNIFRVSTQEFGCFVFRITLLSNSKAEENLFGKRILMIFDLGEF